MTNENKLKKIISFAVERGWNKFGHKKWKVETDKHVVLDIFSFSEKEILFSHSFAKAVFGEDWSMAIDVQTRIIPMKVEDADLARNHHQALDKWQYHLQQAVISEDPIQYYYDYVKSNDK